MEQNWGVPQQQGASGPPRQRAFSLRFPALRRHGAYPPMAPRAYPMFMAAPAQQAMPGAAPRNN